MSTFKLGVYDVSQFASMLRQYKTFKEMKAGFKKEVKSAAVRKWYIGHFEKHLCYYGKEFKNRFDMTPKQMKAIKKLVYGAEKKVRITRYIAHY